MNAPKKKLVIKKKPSTLKQPEETEETEQPESPPDSSKTETEKQPREAADETAAKKQDPKTLLVKKSQEKDAGRDIMKFFCVYCGQKLSAPVKMTGDKIDCPACRRNLVIPPLPEE